MFLRAHLEYYVQFCSLCYRKDAIELETEVQNVETLTQWPKLKGEVEQGRTLFLETHETKGWSYGGV